MEGFIIIMVFVVPALFVLHYFIIRNATLSALRSHAAQTKTDNKQ